MNQIASFLIIFGYALLLGIRHGIDYDHIAAIFDITSSQETKKEGIKLSGLYALGHGVMVFIFGISVIFLGRKISPVIDSYVGKIVGITLILLGIYVFYSLIRFKKEFQMKSRWIIILNNISHSYHSILHATRFKHSHSRSSRLEKYETKTAFTIGAIHGVGVETPTQILAFSSLLKLNGVIGFFFLLFFILGVFMCNVGVSIVSASGYMQTNKYVTLRVFVGILTAVFSIATGFVLIFK